MKGGAAVVPVINAIRSEFDVVVFTRDCHPSNHVSFASNHPGTKPFEDVEVIAFSPFLT